RARFPCRSRSASLALFRTRHTDEAPRRRQGEAELRIAGRVEEQIVNLLIGGAHAVELGLVGLRAGGQLGEELARQRRPAGEFVARGGGEGGLVGALVDAEAEGDEVAVGGRGGGDLRQADG